MITNDFYAEYYEILNQLEALEAKGKQLLRHPRNLDDKELACHVECLVQAQIAL